MKKSKAVISTVRTLPCDACGRWWVEEYGPLMRAALFTFSMNVTKGSENFYRTALRIAGPRVAGARLCSL